MAKAKSGKNFVKDSHRFATDSHWRNRNPQGFARATARNNNRSNGGSALRRFLRETGEIELGVHRAQFCVKTAQMITPEQIA